MLFFTLKAEYHFLISYHNNIQDFTHFYLFFIIFVFDSHFFLLLPTSAPNFSLTYICFKFHLFCWHLLLNFSSLIDTHPKFLLLYRHRSYTPPLKHKFLPYWHPSPISPPLLMSTSNFFTLADIRPIPTDTRMTHSNTPPTRTPKLSWRWMLGTTCWCGAPWMR